MLEGQSFSATAFSAKWVFSLSCPLLRHFSTKGFYVISLLNSSAALRGTGIIIPNVQLDKTKEIGRGL